MTSPKTPILKPTAAIASTRKPPSQAPPAPDSRSDEKSEEAPLPKSYLDAEELERFKELLLKKRAEICGDVRSLTDEALNRSGNSHGDQSTMPIHMADLGTDNWEQEFTLGLIANEQAVVREIDEALERVRNQTYGMCLATHKRITKARLRAKPWAKYCIEYERAREEGRVP
jgi:RNA polymerase-binding transcription factor DksA